MVKMLDIPCGKCGWKMLGFHVCVLDFSTPEGLKRATFTESTELGAPSPLNRPGRIQPRKRSNRQHQSDAGSEEHRARIAEGVRKARANDPGRAERDEEILRLYDMHHSIRSIATMVEADQRTVSSVVKAAAAAGQVELKVNRGGRPRQDAA